MDLGCDLKTAFPLFEPQTPNWVRRWGGDVDVRIISCDVAVALKAVWQFYLHVVSQSTMLLTFRESLAPWRIKTHTAVNRRQQYIPLNPNFRAWGHSRVCLRLQNSVIEGRKTSLHFWTCFMFIIFERKLRTNEQIIFSFPLRSFVPKHSTFH